MTSAKGVFKRNRTPVATDVTTETENTALTAPVKLAVVYDSSTGTITEVAQEIGLAAENAGAEVRVAAPRRPPPSCRRWKTNTPPRVGT
jgi:sulfite reductase alpha subunit-like flavoprotein